MFEYFYNEIFRSVIIAFGSIFNGIEIRKDSGNIRVIRSLASRDETDFELAFEFDYRTFQFKPKEI